LWRAPALRLRLSGCEAFSTTKRGGGVRSPRARDRGGYPAAIMAHQTPRRRAVPRLLRRCGNRRRSGQIPAPAALDPARSRQYDPASRRRAGRGRCSQTLRQARCPKESESLLRVLPGRRLGLSRPMVLDKRVEWPAPPTSGF
jgi:hypothetical protein